MFKIISLEKDSSQRWYARVAINESETMFLKFFDKPTQEQIDLNITNYLLSLETNNDITE
jgi:hypothetical protein